jgi:hypothetical protein
MTIPKIVISISTTNTKTVKSESHLLIANVRTMCRSAFIIESDLLIDNVRTM